MLSEKQIKRLNSRYLRKVISGEKFVHHGDCHIFSFAGICTCGLIHDLMPLDPKDARKLYKDFEKDYKEHMKNISDHEYYVHDLSGEGSV